MSSLIKISFFLFVVLLGVAIFLTYKPVPNPNPSPSLIPIPTPTPTPYPEASNISTLPPLYPNIKWSTKVKYKDVVIDKSGFKWVGELTKVEGENDLKSMFSNSIYKYYENLLSQQGWSIYNVDSDGPTGVIRGFIGYKNGQERVLELQVDVSNANQNCGYICPCPCIYTYTLFASDLAKITE